MAAPTTSRCPTGAAPCVRNERLRRSLAARVRASVYGYLRGCLWRRFSRSRSGRWLVIPEPPRPRCAAAAVAVFRLHAPSSVLRDDDVRCPKHSAGRIVLPGHHPSVPGAIPSRSPNARSVNPLRAHRASTRRISRARTVEHEPCLAIGRTSEGIFAHGGSPPLHGVRHTRLLSSPFPRLCLAH